MSSSAASYSLERRTGSRPVAFGKTAVCVHEDEPWGGPVAQTHRRTNSRIVRTIKGRERVPWQTCEMGGGEEIRRRSFDIQVEGIVSLSLSLVQLCLFCFPFFLSFLITVLPQARNLLKGSERVGRRRFTRIAHKTGEQKGQSHHSAVRRLSTR